MITSTSNYPATPGWKTDHPDTSKAAALAETSRASILRTQVVSCYHHHGNLTADEVAELLHESVLSVRPRVTELCKCDPPVLEDSGERRRNASGHSAAVRRLCEQRTQQELGLC